ncbi:hypothetical protein G9A89_005503 [Geosiphon pyriformis]|nr:hypothetical protein G9A89_005503 [Geosiphon pyriformis]
MCSFDLMTHVKILSKFYALWSSLTGIAAFFSTVVQNLTLCACDDGFYFMLAKVLGAFSGPEHASSLVVNFVRDFVSIYRSVVWYKRSEHHACVEKMGLIATDSSLVHLNRAIVNMMSSGVVRLLSLDKIKSLYSGTCPGCLLFTGLGGMVLVVEDL